MESAAANVEGPAHEGTDLVAVEVAVDVGGDAGVGFVNILPEELGSSFLGDGESCVDIRASVAVTDGPNSIHVLVGSETQALEIHDEVEGIQVPVSLGDVKII